jgi:hypothetical protein
MSGKLGLSQELHNLYSSNIIRAMKSMRMRWVGHIPHVGKMRNTKFYCKNLKGSDHFGYLCIGWRIILKWALKK